MGAVSNFSQDVQNNIERQGELYASDDSGTTYYNLGQIKNLELSMSEVTTEADTAGRQKQNAVDVEVTGVLQQTSDTELANLAALTNPSGNGLYVFASSEHTDKSTVEGGTASGYTFQNCLFRTEGTINFGGDESEITVTFGGRVDMSELENLGSSQTLTFDA